MRKNGGVEEELERRRRGHEKEWRDEEEWRG
jgi:hypothetical protein